MADFAVNVVKIAATEKHPQADRLSLATMEGQGYTVVAGLDEFNPGDRAFYFPLDAVIPDRWIDRFGIRSFYATRVCPARIRGVFSEGLLVSLSRVPELPDPELGRDYAPFFGVSKYVHAIPEHMGGDALRHAYAHESFPEPQHLKKYATLLAEGEEVVMTEKLHGSCFTVRNAPEEGLLVGCYNLFFKDNHANDRNVYVRTFRENPELQRLPRDTQVFGEVFGDVQDLKYGMKKDQLDYAVFAVRCGKRTLDFDEQAAFCREHGLRMAPLLYRGPFSLEVVKSFDKADSVYCPGQLMEGVVVVPVQERLSPEIGRVCLKFISQRYLLRKGGSENK